MDDRRAKRAERRQGGVEDRALGRADVLGIGGDVSPRHAYARASERVRATGLDVVGNVLEGDGRGRRVTLVFARDHRQQGSRICDRAAHRTDRVLQRSVGPGQ